MESVADRSEPLKVLSTATEKQICDKIRLKCDFHSKRGDNEFLSIRLILTLYYIVNITPLKFNFGVIGSSPRDAPRQLVVNEFL